jgi:hypothetical protein
MRLNQKATVVFIIAFVFGVVFGFVWVQMYHTEYTNNLREAYNTCAKMYNDCAVKQNLQAQKLPEWYGINESSGIYSG